MKKRTLFFLSVCAVALNGYVVHADSLEAPSQLVTVPNLPETGGQLTVVEEAGQLKAILSNITGEIVGVTGQFKSETNTGKTIAFTIDASGQYVAYLDRADFSNQEELYSLSLAANLLDGSSHVMNDYTFKLTKVEEVQRTEDNLSTETDPSESTVISESKPENSSETADITPIETGSSSSSSLAEKVTETTTAEVIETPVTSNNIDDVLTSIGTQLRSASALSYAGEAGGRGSAGQSVTRTITKVQQKEQILEISYTPPIKSNEIIQFAVWSEKLNQDDIIWYNADKTGAAYVDLRKYRDYGKYHIHTYSNMNGKMVFLDKVEITVKEPVVDQKIIQTSDTTFDVVLTNVPNYYSRVQIPVWSDQNGQDELKWYEAVRQTDGSYKATFDLKNHKYDTGLYHIHGYGSLPNGSRKAVLSTKYTVPNPTITHEIKAIGPTTYDVIVKGIPSYYSRVQIPVWSDQNGQDELKWYEAVRQTDGSYKATFDLKNHKYDTGLYHIHGYGSLPNGSRKAVLSTKYTVPNPTITHEIKAIGPTTYDVIVKGIPSYYSRVQIPVWSDQNGQDELKWYEAVRQTDGSYKATFDLKNHKYDTGLYHIHGYGSLPNGSRKAVLSTKYTVPNPTITHEIKAIGPTTYDVIVKGIPSYYSRVQIPVWSDQNGQDELKWYEAVRQTDGSYKATFDLKNHKYDTGLYHIHGYGSLPNGSRKAVLSTKYTVPAFDITKEQPSARSYTIFIDPGHGGVDPGASYGGVQEKNLALSVANKLKANLIQLGYQVLMTRTADYNVDFKTERSKMANQSNADLFISIHFNATGSTSSNATGIETYWYQYDPEYQPKINAEMHNDPTRLAESEILANQVQASLISGTGAVNRGVRRDTFAVLRETAIPAILVELGFMNNPSDLQKIKEDAYQTKLANALAQGIDNWYGAVGSKPTSGTSTQKKSTEQSQMTTSQQSFFNNILPAIQQVSQKNSIVTSVALAQSILESGWGTSQLAKNANNIFGIKADSSWKGNTYTVQTKEVVNGKTITVEKQFRAYKSLSESISDYGSFFTSTAWRTKNYASFLQATNYETALTSLSASGYATDPAYAEKLKSLIQRYGLDQYDLN